MRKSVNKRLITPKLRRAVNIVHRELGPVCVLEIIADLSHQQEKAASNSFQKYVGTAPKWKDGDG